MSVTAAPTTGSPGHTTCAWAGSVSAFLAVPDTDLLDSLTRFLRETGTPQLFAWDRSIRSLKTGLVESLPEAADCGLVLEYDYPRSGGRRPDLIFLNNGVVLVIEFKNRVRPESSDFDQVLGYVRDLRVGGQRERTVLLEMEKESGSLEIGPSVRASTAKLASSARDHGITVPATDQLVAARAMHHPVGLEHNDGHFPLIDALPHERER